MAGVKGPCPSCRNPIEAPLPEKAPEPETPDSFPPQAAAPEQASRQPDPLLPSEPAPALAPAPAPPAPAPVATGRDPGEVAPVSPLPEAAPQPQVLPTAPAARGPDPLRTPPAPAAGDPPARGFPEPTPIPSQASTSDFPDPFTAPPPQASPSSFPDPHAAPHPANPPANPALAATGAPPSGPVDPHGPPPAAPAPVFPTTPAAAGSQTPLPAANNGPGQPAAPWHFPAPGPDPRIDSPAPSPPSPAFGSPLGSLELGAPPSGPIPSRQGGESPSQGMTPATPAPQFGDPDPGLTGPGSFPAGSPSHRDAEIPPRQPSDDPRGHSPLPLDTLPPPAAGPIPGHTSHPEPSAPSSPPASDPFPSQSSSALPAGLIPSPKPGEPTPQNTLPISYPGSTPSPANAGAAEQPSAPPTENPRRLRWPGIVFPLLFIILAAIMVYLVLDLSELLPKNSRKIPTPPADPQAIPPPANAEARARAVERPTNPIVPTQHNTPVTGRQPGGTTKGPLIEEIDRKVEGEVPLPPILDFSSETIKTTNSIPAQKAAGKAPNEPAAILEKFLSASTLEERRPFLTKSRRSDKVLASSPLAQPLPEVVHRRIIHYMEDASEKHTEHFFEVSFLRSPDVTPVPILVQLNEWGDGQIRVHTDAFLDLFDDELSVFARAPVAGERTFHVVGDAYKHCFDESIPEAGKKSFIKLRAHPRITPRLKAYFASDSSMAQQISRPNALPWGFSGVCTVTVKWNTSTPNKPFVELLRVDGFTWNP